MLFVSAVATVKFDAYARNNMDFPVGLPTFLPIWSETEKEKNMLARELTGVVLKTNREMRFVSAFCVTRRMAQVKTTTLMLWLRDPTTMYSFWRGAPSDSTASTPRVSRRWVLR